MSRPPESDGGDPREVWPLLLVADLTESLRFYRDGLGFAVVGRAETNGSLFWCRLKRGASAVMLQARHPEDAPDSAGTGGISLYFVCDDVDVLHAEFAAAGLAVSPPSVAPYGMRQLFVPDPDGYSICFEAPTANWIG